MKELSNVKDKLEVACKENGENLLAFKEERQKFKQDVKESNDEISAMSSKVDQMEEMMRQDAGTREDIMREVRNGYEQQIEQLNKDKHKSLVEANELRNNLDSTEKKLKKESSALETLKTRLEVTSDALTSASSELRKLKEVHEKVSKRCSKQEEKVKTFEEHFDEVLQQRIGEIMSKNSDLETELIINKQAFIENDAQIGRLELRIEKGKGALKEEKKFHKETIGELSTINVRIERQQKRLSLLEYENMRKLDEIDRLMAEGDKSREELARLFRTYNFNSIDKSNALLANFATWGGKLVPQVSRIKNVLEQYFCCRLCNSIPLEMIIMWPCEHIFCQLCLDRQGPISTCPSCAREKERTLKTDMLTDLVDEFEGIVQVIQHAKQDYKLLDLAYEKVEEAKRNK